MFCFRYSITRVKKSSVFGSTVIALRNLIVYGMLILTLVSMFGVASRMLELRQQMGIIDDVPLDNPLRVEFNRLHHWSTRIETTVLVLGLALLYLASRRLS